MMSGWAAPRVSKRKRTPPSNENKGFSEQLREEEDAAQQPPTKRQKDGVKDVDDRASIGVDHGPMQSVNKKGEVDQSVRHGIANTSSTFALDKSEAEISSSSVDITTTNINIDPAYTHRQNISQERAVADTTTAADVQQDRHSPIMHTTNTAKHPSRLTADSSLATHPNEMSHWLGTPEMATGLGEDGSRQNKMSSFQAEQAGRLPEKKNRKASEQTVERAEASEVLWLSVRPEQ